MAKPTLQITTLYDYSLDGLIDIKNTTDCKYTRLALTVITMKYLHDPTAKVSLEELISLRGLKKSFRIATVLLKRKLIMV